MNSTKINVTVTAAAVAVAMLFVLGILTDVVLLNEYKGWPDLILRVGTIGFLLFIAYYSEKERRKKEFDGSPKAVCWSCGITYWGRSLLAPGPHHCHKCSRTLPMASIPVNGKLPHLRLVA